MPDTICEVPGCDRPVMEHRRQRSGDELRVCGQPHITVDHSDSGES